MNDKEIEKVVLHNHKMIHNKIMLKFFSLENQIETYAQFLILSLIFYLHFFQQLF